jgi:hypothetical protein
MSHACVTASTIHVRAWRCLYGEPPTQLPASRKSGTAAGTAPPETQFLERDELEDLLRHGIYKIIRRHASRFDEPGIGRRISPHTKPGAASQTPT